MGFIKAIRITSQEFLFVSLLVSLKEEGEFQVFYLPGFQITSAHLKLKNCNI